MRARIEDRVVYSPFPAVDIPCCSFYNAAKKALLKNPDKLALADGAVAVTRSELFVLMQRYAAGFQRHGVEPGDRVCVFLTNSVDSFVGMWSCVFAGASIVLARPSLTERELRYQLHDCNSTHVLTEPASAEKAFKAAAGLQMKGFFATGAAEGFVSTADFRDLDEASFREVPIQDPRDCVLCISYTSGTTGLPKGVICSHYGIVANMATQGPCYPWEESDVLLVAAPITHASGFTFVTFGVLLGAAVVMASHGASFQRVSELVNKYTVTALSVLPTHLTSLVADMTETGNRLVGVRRIGLSGSAFPDPARKPVKAAFSDLKTIVNVYAMSECMGILCSPSIHGTQGSDVGFPVPWAKIKVVDMVTRQKLGPNLTGEICFRAPTVFKEYHNRTRESAEAFDKDDWCKTGAI
ncbi:uncharacterized protein LOC144097953 [Amblyomma americanum]